MDHQLLAEMRMCREYGYTPEQVRQLPLRDFVYLNALIQKEPTSIGLATAIASTTVPYINMKRDSTTHPEPFHPKDVIPWCNQETPDEYLTDDERQKRKATENEAALAALLDIL